MRASIPGWVGGDGCLEQPTQPSTPFNRRNSSNGSLRSLLSSSGGTSNKRDNSAPRFSGTMSRLPPKPPPSTGGTRRRQTAAHASHPSKPEFSIGTRLTSPVRRNPSVESLESEASTTASTSKRSSFIGGLSPSFARRLNISFRGSRGKKKAASSVGNGSSCHSCGASPLPCHRENRVNDDSLGSEFSGSVNSLNSLAQQLQQLPPLGQLHSLRSYQPLVSHGLYRRPPSSLGSTPIQTRRINGRASTSNRLSRRTSHSVSTTGQPVDFRPSLFLDPNQGKTTTITHFLPGLWPIKNSAR